MRLLHHLAWMYTRVYRYLCAALMLACPYIAIAADRQAYAQRGYIAHGGEFILPVLVFALIFGLYWLGKQSTEFIRPKPQTCRKDENRRRWEDFTPSQQQDHLDALKFALLNTKEEHHDSTVL